MRGRCDRSDSTADEHPTRKRAVFALRVRRGGALMITVVVELRMLAQQMILTLVRASDFASRILERLEHGNSPVLVGIRDVSRVRLDEVLSESRLVLFEIGFRGGGDHAVRSR